MLAVVCKEGVESGCDWIEGEDSREGLSKLRTHGAIENEVDGGVEEGNEIHELSEWGVAVGKELVSVEGREEAEDPLRELRDEEEDENGEEHSGRPISQLVPPLNPAAPTHPIPQWQQLRLSPLCLHEGVDEAETHHRQH